jgi:U2 small nuclear ribonucleoprotein B''
VGIIGIISIRLIVDPLVRYKGFRSNHVVQSPTPNEAGAKVKMAQVLFDSSDLAAAAKDAMDGFLLKKGWKMSVAYF